MDTIESKVDTLRRLGQLFIQFNANVQNDTRMTVYTCLEQLGDDWAGVSRQQYNQLYHEWCVTAERLVAIGEEISRHLQETTMRFEQSAQQFSH